ncbi:GNAT family N-acetyltransferase [Oceanicella sp. SM1341]|uniref:GNAT family N-acetyltransferase n=1 Tax=Oceanicella sp. SM1341 TaxID=1548889 RepID=UPI00130037C2|nr:GNAT family N-acetyltransferase [Oceanicella sp. SM1341]
MRREDPVTIREAVRGDAPLLARLIDIAGEGIPSWLWQRNAGPGETPLHYGTIRAARDEGAFSWRNCLVGMAGLRPVAMMLGSLVTEPDEEEIAALPALPEPIRPLVELEHEAVGSYYVNALAVWPGFRDRGIGSRLLAAAEARGRALGAQRISIQVFSQNTHALRLYERAGYRVAGRRPILLHPCQPWYDEDVLLLLKDAG